MKEKSASSDKIKIHSKVFYPSHGPGKVVRKKKIEFGGEENEYYEFEFINKKLTISTPIDNVQKLGIRHVYSARKIRDAIKVLKSKPALKPKTKDYTELINLIQELDAEGEVESFVKIIQYSNYEKKVRDKEGRLIPVSIVKHINTSIEHLVGELALAEGFTFEKAAKAFTRATGHDVKGQED